MILCDGVTSKKPIILSTKISDELLKFSWEPWKTRVNENQKEKIAEPNIESGIFQRDLLSQLVLFIATIPLSYVFRKWTGATNLQTHKRDKLPYLHGCYQCTWK